MAFNDDSFIREVNEELRSDRMQFVWRRFGRLIIGCAVLVVLGTAGYVGYRYWATHQAGDNGDRFIAALALADQNKNDEALAALTAIEKDGKGMYPLLASMRAAFLLVETGTYEQVSALAEELAVPANAFRHSAREVLGLAAYKAGDFAKAKQWFQAIVSDQQSPRNVANRAQMMLDNIAASGKAPQAQG